MLPVPAVFVFDPETGSLMQKRDAVELLEKLAALRRMHHA